MTLSNRISLDSTHNPRGIDGRGWNRIAIHGMQPTMRCTLKPNSRQAALDTLRGMAQFGVATEYRHCTSTQACENCAVVTKEKDPWDSSWAIKEDGHGKVWLLGCAKLGFAGKGYCFADWESLLANIEVPMLKRMVNTSGHYWVAE